MRKTMAVLLAVSGMLMAGGRVANAAAGVGLEWSIGPTIPVQGFDIKMGQQFALDWKVSDSFSVGVWNASSLYRGEKSYTDVTVTTLKHKLVTQGTVGASGITLMTTLPAISMLELGVNLGVENLTNTSLAATNSDGTAGALADFGAPVALTTTAPLLGLNARANLIKAETKTVTTNIGITAAFNWVQFSDTAALGTREALGKLDANGLTKKIDPVSSYTQVTVMVNASIWF